MRSAKQKSTIMVRGNTVFLVEGQSLGINVTGNIFELNEATENVVTKFQYNRN